MANKTVAIVVEVIIFTALIGTIFSSLAFTHQENGSNVTGASVVLIGLVGVFVVIGFFLLIIKQMGGSR